MGKRLLIGGFIGFLAIVVLVNEREDGKTPRPAAATPVTAEEQQRIAATDAFFKPPAEQEAFASIVAAARQQYRNAANDLARGGFRNTRKNDLCREFTQGAVKGWTGTISTLSSNSDGKGVLTVDLGQSVWATTWNNALSDVGDSTLIDPDSGLFSQLSVLSEGARVKFDGSFLRSKQNADCLKERSVTQDGSMTEPEFLFKFTKVSTHSN